MSPQAHSMFGFPDARAFLNRAIDSQNGVRAIFPEWKGAFSFRMRLYTYRKRERALNSKVYEPGQWNTTGIPNGMYVVIIKTKYKSYKKSFILSR